MKYARFHIKDNTFKLVKTNQSHEYALGLAKIFEAIMEISQLPPPGIVMVYKINPIVITIKNTEYVKPNTFVMYWEGNDYDFPQDLKNPGIKLSFATK